MKTNTSTNAVTSEKIQASNIFQSLLQHKLAMEAHNLPIHAAILDKESTAANIIDGHYQKIKEEVCQQLEDYLLDKKLHTELSAMDIRTAYLQDAQRLQRLTKHLLQLGLEPADIALLTQQLTPKAV